MQTVTMFLMVRYIINNILKSEENSYIPLTKQDEKRSETRSEFADAKVKQVVLLSL